MSYTRVQKEVTEECLHISVREHHKDKHTLLEATNTGADAFQTL